MKVRNLPFLLALMLASNANAATGVYESYGILKINASTNLYYDMQAATGNPDFQGANLGIFDTSMGNTLVLAGGEIKTFKNGGSNVTGARFDYRVFKLGDTPSAFSEFNLNFNSNLSGTFGNEDQKWDNTGANVNLLNSLGNGNYTVEVFAYSTTSTDGNQFSNNGGNNFKANFTVIPEPSSAIFGLLGTVMLLRRRK